MRHHTPFLTLGALLLFCACAASSGQVPKGMLESTDLVWPSSVATECPERKVSVECFRAEGFPRTALKSAMGELRKQLEACGRDLSEPVNVRLTMETRGGRLTCVDPSVWVAPLEKYQSLKWLAEDRLAEAEVARCAAGLVARHLVLPDSPEEEHCRWVSGFIF